MKFATTIITAALAAMPVCASAQSALSGEPIQIVRAAGRIQIDGDLSDEGWRGATRVDKWYEARPGDNTEPKIKNVGYLSYDDRFFYAAFEFEDPNPSVMRAPFSDRDDIGNGLNDYGGILLDGRGTGSNGVFFVVTPRNVQYDSIVDDSTDEDASPDFFWDSATRITPHGWTVEMRIPFSSIRYHQTDPQPWHILLYRNYPRDFHYQFFSARMPRNGNCFVCRSNVLTGLKDLPSGGHLVAAPFAATSDVAEQSGDPGSPLGRGTVHSRVGFDVKLLPNADNAIDLTVKPDFSQVESDTAQIATNQRFALFFPEKRPFFLEGTDLFATPIQAVYTRTITAPVVGGRATGKAAGLRYTVLVAEDDGGGSAVVPGPTGSSLAAVDFGSTVLIARAKHDLGLSFVSLLATDRERRDGQGHNRVIGPDVRWRASPANVVAGQLLFSQTKTPNQPDVASEWTGRTLTGHAGVVQWNHATTHLDWFALYRDFGDEFRADTGFVPQVGYRQTNGYVGWTMRPSSGFLSSVRPFMTFDEQVDRSGHVISRDLQPGVGMDTKMSGFIQSAYYDDRIRTPAGILIDQRQFGYFMRFSPSSFFAQVEADGRLGEDIDFENSRAGHGSTIDFSATLRPTEHLEMALVQNQQWLNVDDADGRSRRLFTARVSRAKGTYTFTSRLFVRAIAQYVSTDRDPSLYLTPVEHRSASLSGSMLVAYKLNWQSVLYIGYGDDRELTAPLSSPGGPAGGGHRLTPVDRQVFVKIGYAFQR